MLYTGVKIVSFSIGPYDVCISILLNYMYVKRSGNLHLTIQTCPQIHSETGFMRDVDDKKNHITHQHPKSPKIPVMPFTGRKKSGLKSPIFVGIL